MPSPAQRKKLDSRIPTLIANCVQNRQRPFFVIVGDHGKEHVMTLHFLLTKARVSSRPSVLWCYKKDLGFTSHRKKRERQIKAQIKKGIRQADEDDPFELFISSTDIRYTYYKETDKVLGNTFGMCILQDFEAITPNILARTIETVEGGGAVVILLKSMSSLKQLYTMTMDVHSRYRTEAQHDTVARFNERFLLSLGSCDTCLVLDDELNVLPISAGKDVKPLPHKQYDAKLPEEIELEDLQKSLADTEHVGNIVSKAKTIDQAKAVLTFVEAIAEKTLRSTVTLTAARGRGKSAALGLAMAAAIAYGYSNIFITSPTPENLKTLFEFCFKGFDALGYEEHMDYDIVQSVNPDFQKAVVRVNVFKNHRQTIQYIQPSDHQMLAQAELLIIDEAAAIPLPIVKNLLGPYLVFMASTINGYEGTGRSLSIKLFQQLREQSQGFAANESDKKNGSAGGRTLREVTLHTPIRYGSGDPVESWLNKLLCLDCCSPNSGLSRNALAGGCPHPSECDLYYVNRDSLFSFHPVSEAFLQKMMSLYVASHYKNSPNDLQLMSDAPAHHLFVLLPPISQTSVTVLPEPLVVIQVCLEGSISKKTAMAALSKGTRHSGDLIPWVVSQQFQDDDFASLSGGRIVRIATHPDYVGMGYGARAMRLLEEYYLGKFVDVNEKSKKIIRNVKRVTEEEIKNASLETDQIKVRDPATMPPLLLRLAERPLESFEHLHWLGVSFGVTPALHKFWKRAGYSPVYVRQTSNDLTGEHTCIMLKTLQSEAHHTQMDEEMVLVGKSSWLSDFSADFLRRFIELLAYQLRDFSPIMVLSLLEAASKSKDGSDKERALFVAINSKQEVYRHYTPHDLKRLKSYNQNLLDYHVIQDLVPSMAKQYFLGQLSNLEGEEPVHLSAVQAAIMCGVGLQKKTIDELEKELNLPNSQVLALFAKAVKKCSNYLETVLKTSEAEPQFTVINEQKRSISDDEAWDPMNVSLNEELTDAQNELMTAMKAKQKEMIDNLDLEKYAIQADDKEWENAKMSKESKIVNLPSQKSTKKRKAEKESLFKSKKLEQDGIVDPNNVLKRSKKAKQKLKAINA